VETVCSDVELDDLVGRLPDPREVQHARRRARSLRRAEQAQNGISRTLRRACASACAHRAGSMSVTATLAALVPARRAAAVDSLRARRTESSAGRSISRL
jgi:hypothetical protein